MSSLPATIRNIQKRGNSIILQCRIAQVKGVIAFLKLSSLIHCKSLLDMWACDNREHDIKQQLIYYMFLTLFRNSRIYLKSKIQITHAFAKAVSITELFPSANFLEREIWDLFGIFFIKHPDLRRLLTDYGFSGHPLRKDFPVTGFKEIKYDDSLQKLIYQPVRFTQAYRVFSYKNPWRAC
jgi:NADH-quinone oxidoreductase subunit C